MNQLKITFTGKVVKRWRKMLSNGKEKVFVAVSDCAAQFPKAYQFTAKSSDQVKPFAVGADVTVTAWVDGREWKKSETETLYFTDLTIAEIVDAGAAHEAAEALAGSSPDGAAASEELPF